MADSTITGLPAGVTIGGTEVFPADQAGTTVKLTAAQIAAYVVSGAGFGTMALQNANAVAITGGTAVLSTLSAGTVAATGAITGSASKGAYSYGTLSYSDTNTFASYNTSVNSYAQLILQNSSSGATASTDIVVSNNNGTATTYYGNFGINSSGYTGTGSQNAPNNVYLTATSGDLVVGTTTSNAIHFNIGAVATDQFGIGTSGQLLVAGSAGTSGQVLQSGGPSAAPSWVTAGTGTVTTVSVVTANGFAGSVANASSTPAITLTTSITGVLKGNGTAISAATAGTDYVSPSATATYSAVQTFPSSDLVIKGSSTGTTAIASANAGATNYTATLPANTGTIAELNLAQTWTAAQTFNNSDILLLGSSTGYTTISSANASATNYTLNLPAGTGTAVVSATAVGVVTGTPSSSTYLRGDGTWATPSGSGNVSGPGSSTNGYIPTWNGTTGTVLAAGYNVSGSGNVALTTSAVLTTPALTGSSSGNTTLASANASSTNYTATFPANTGTVAELNYSQTWTAGQLFQANTLAVLGSSTGYTNFNSANSGATNYTLTLPAANANVLASVTAVPAATGTPSSTTYLRGDGTWATPSGSSSVINGYISGFTLSNDGTTPNSVLDIAAGYAADSTNAVMITGTAFTKTTGGTWVAGTGNAGMGSGLTIAASTWYHVFGIINGGSFDVYFDTSATAANKPASTTAFRYIGSLKTDASSHILAFFQAGQTFTWTAAVTDISSGGTTSLTLTALTVPPGFATFPIMFASQTGSGGNAQFGAAGNGSSATPPTLTFPNPAGSTIAVPPVFATNTSSQLYVKTSIASNLNVVTAGYVNPHVGATY